MNGVIDARGLHPFLTPSPSPLPWLPKQDQAWGWQDGLRLIGGVHPSRPEGRPLPPRAVKRGDLRGDRRLGLDDRSSGSPGRNTGAGVRDAVQ